MSNYNDELMRYEEDAEDQYDDFDDDGDMYDDEEDDFETGFDGLEDGYDEEYEDEYDDYDDFIDEGEYDEDMYDNYSKTSIGKIDPNDRTLTVVVNNTSGAAAEAVIFGGNAESAQPAGVTVVVEESSHKEVREESKSNPFKIAGMKYSVSNALQFDNVLRIDRRTASGSKTTRVYQPRNATSPQNFSQSLIDDDNFEMGCYWTGFHYVWSLKMVLLVYSPLQSKQEQTLETFLKVAMLPSYHVLQEQRGYLNWIY